MSLNNPIAGQNWAAELISSGLPFLTSSIASSSSFTRIDFPYVTNNITITNKDLLASSSLAFAGSVNDFISNNKFIVQGSKTINLNVATKNLFIRGENSTPSYSMVASLTTIPSSFLTTNEPYLPYNLSPQLWLRSDLGTTIATGVSRWADQSNNGNDVIQATAARQPVITGSLANGLPALWWGFPTNSTNTKKLTSLTNFQITGDFEWYCICYVSTEDAAAQLVREASIQKISMNLSLEDTGYTNRYQLTPLYSNANTHGAFIVGSVGGFSSNFAIKNKIILTTMRRSGVVAVGALDNTITSVTNGPNMGAAAKIVVGGVNVNDTLPFAGSIFEVVTFNRYLSTTERDKLLAYFSARYGQSWTQ
jgi:hypothetical protein